MFNHCRWFTWLQTLTLQRRHMSANASQITDNSTAGIHLILTTKKSNLRFAGPLWAEITHRKGPVMWKVFPRKDVFMHFNELFIPGNKPVEQKHRFADSYVTTYRTRKMACMTINTNIYLNVFKMIRCYMNGRYRAVFCFGYTKNLVSDVQLGELPGMNRSSHRGLGARLQ